VPAGSVGIGGSSTGVYPFTSPGGWHIIGRTPRVLFSATRDRPSLLQAGDRVRFTAISASSLRALMETP
jgi:inhibitor of KinA